MRVGDILDKALLVIDEYFPTNDAGLSQGAQIAPCLAQFLGSAIQWVHLLAPVRLLPLAPFPDAPRPKEDGSGAIPLPDDFLRLHHLRMEGWKCSLFHVYEANSVQAMQQASSVLRGVPTHPRCCFSTNEQGERELRYYSLPITQKEHRIQSGGYVARVVVDLPLQTSLESDVAVDPLLLDAVALKTASFYLQSIENAQGAQLCEGQLSQLLPLLA